MTSLFEKMIQDFSRKDTAELLGECMRMNESRIRKIPVRYRLIALGFVTGMGLEQLEQKLEENGCGRLYARNPTEVSLIYAFKNGISYAEWKRLEAICEQMEEENGLKDPWFNGSSVSYRELKDYVRVNSDGSGNEYRTGRITRELQEQLRMTGSEEDFRQFLQMNWESFRPLREKARYYFCKFLNYYVEEKAEAYLAARRNGFGLEQAGLDLNILKCTAQLRRKFSSEQEIWEVLEASSISFGNLYDAFNYYYFGYISMDWMEVLLDYYGGDLTRLGENQKRELARALRAYDGHWKNYTDDEVLRRKWEQIERQEQILDRQYSLEEQEQAGSAVRGYQKNRSGEKSVRSYIKGTLDLDRTTLICYLLFFGKEFLNHRERRLTRERLDRILLECGYPALRGNDDFDSFLLQYLAAEDRVDYLMESVTKRAMEEKNFYLYHMYRGSVSEDRLLKELMHQIGK